MISSKKEKDFRNYIRRFSQVNSREELDKIILLKNRYDIQFVISAMRFSVSTYKVKTFEEIFSKIGEEIDGGKTVYFYYLHHLENGDWAFRASFK